MKIAPSGTAESTITDFLVARDLAATSPAKAERMLEEIVARIPNFLPARRLLARILRNRRESERAAAIELESIALGMVRPSFVQAEEAFLADDLDRAEPLIRSHLRGDPEDPAAAFMLGEIAARCNAPAEAANLYGRAILIAPSYVEPRLALAKLHRDHGRYEDALLALDGLLSIRPDHLAALSLRASIFEQLREFEKAEAAFRELNERHPGDARGWTNHAFLLKTIGRQDDAVTAYRRALSIDDNYPLAWWGLSNLKTVRFTPADVAKIELAIERDQHSGAERVNLLYALGKARDDQRDYEGAFAAYSAGAEERLKDVPYDPQKVQDHVSESQATCTSSFFSERSGWGSDAKDPIFIVSLPRSGSTLVEQILASHSLIEGTEELHDVERIALSLGKTDRTGAWLEELPRLGREQLRDLGNHYIEATRRFRHTGRPYFTDKMPSNWVFLGLIRTMLPNAKIIDIRRHPLGCGFANFSQHFNWGINFSYDLDHIAGFYRAYLRQMAHFDRVAPGWIHHVVYENLVENTESEIRRMIDYLDLPFDSQCLRFFENKRAVFTPSSEQVRSPINREGMERWQRYEPFLGPLKEALGPILDHYPAVPPGLDHPQA